MKRITRRDRARYRLHHLIYDNFWHEPYCNRYHQGGHAKKPCNCGRDTVLAELYDKLGPPIQPAEYHAAPLPTSDTPR